MRAPLLYGTAGSMLLTALVTAPAGSTQEPAGAQGPRSAEAAGAALAAERAGAAGIRFGACPESEMMPPSVQCGTVQVPLDYAEPDGKKIRLTVSRIKAKGKASKRQGALVFNPGGPGGSGMYFPMVASFPTWKPLASAYDLVGYAPRGVGRSAPLSCQDPKTFQKAPTQAPTNPSEAYKQQRMARAKAKAEGCAERAGSSLRHYTSLNNARDLDVLRAGLGERKLTFMGASYGTYIGALYATLFPSHVRRMVFDSAVHPDPEQIWYRNNLDQSRAFERRWEDFKGWIARHDDTYRLGATADAVQRSYDKARAALAKKPAGGKVGPGQLQSTLLQAAYYDDYWPARAEALSAYLSGDQKPLVELAQLRPEGAVEGENSSAVYSAVECNDAPWPTDWPTWDRDHTALARVAPFETWDNAWANLPCAYWKAPRQQPLDVRALPGDLPPTLILAAEHDAAAPYAGALELRRRLYGASLVTERDTGTHGIAGGSNTCMNAHLETYLLKGEVPGRGADCAARAEPEPRAKADTAKSPAAAPAPGGAVVRLGERAPF